MVLAGCMSPKTSPPLDVRMIPDDCRNKEAIIDWLTEQASIPQQSLESDINYEKHRRSIRAKIWSMRYACQPV